MLDAKDGRYFTVLNDLKITDALVLQNREIQTSQLIDITNITTETI